jgi:hypothetical protein
MYSHHPDIIAIITRHRKGVAKSKFFFQAKEFFSRSAFPIPLLMEEVLASGERAMVDRRKNTSGHRETFLNPFLRRANLCSKAACPIR